MEARTYHYQDQPLYRDDTIGSYRRPAGMLVTYSGYDEPDDRRPASDFHLRIPGITWIASHCGLKHRDDTVLALKPFYPFFSFGGCLNTHSTKSELPHCAGLPFSHGDNPSKVCAMERDLFSWVIENTLDPG